MNILSPSIISIMPSALECADVKWALRLIKCFNFASTFNQQQKLIIALCHRIKFGFMVRFSHSSSLLWWLLSGSRSVLSHGSQTGLDVGAWFIERGNADVVTPWTVFIIASM